MIKTISKILPETYKYNLMLRHKTKIKFYYNRLVSALFIKPIKNFIPITFILVKHNECKCN